MEERTKSPVIGGVFGLAEAGAGATPPPFGAGALFLANARSGILSVARALDPPTIWMPSYLCPVMVGCLGELRERVRFFQIAGDLSVPDWSFLGKVREGDLACVIDYFGWPCSRTLMTELSAAGALVLEDACQALLTDGIGLDADYLLFSPRKFLGVPDGGVLVPRGAAKLELELGDAPEEWSHTAHEAARQRAEFDGRGAADDDRGWYELYQRSEAGPAGPYAMSGVARALLDTAFDYEAIATKRRTNHARLRARLAELALFPEPSPSVVPVGFVVRFASPEDRDRVREGLIAEGIYPPVHWPLAGLVPPNFAESHLLSRRILTLPCDQRYGPEDLDRIADRVENLLGR